MVHHREVVREQREERVLPAAAVAPLADIDHRVSGIGGEAVGGHAGLIVGPAQKQGAIGVGRGGLGPAGLHREPPPVPVGRGDVVGHDVATTVCHQTSPVPGPGAYFDQGPGRHQRGDGVRIGHGPGVAPDQLPASTIHGQVPVQRVVAAGQSNGGVPVGHQVRIGLEGHSRGTALGLVQGRVTCQ